MGEGEAGELSWADDDSRRLARLLSESPEQPLHRHAYFGYDGHGKLLLVIHPFTELVIIEGLPVFSNVNQSLT